MVSAREAIDRPWEWLAHAARGGVAIKAQNLALLEDIAAAERRVRDDYGARYPIELLQNGHDAAAEAGIQGSVAFVLTKDALLVANEGVPFEGSRIQALTRLGATTKNDRGVRRHVIGYKGIGFSSVFNITESPQVASGDVMFGFDRQAALERVEDALGEPPRRVPIRSFPFPQTPEDWGDDRLLLESLREQGAATVIRMPFKEGVVTDQVWKNVLQTVTPRTLLFADSVFHLVLTSSSEVHDWTRRSGPKIGLGQVLQLESATGGSNESWLVARRTVPAPASVADLDDEVWAQVKELNVAVALPWKGEVVDTQAPPQPLYAYFPTDDLTGRSFILHGDFFLNSSRRGIQASGVGAEVTRTVAAAGVSLTQQLVESVADRGGVLEILALRDGAEVNGFGHAFGEVLVETLKQARIVRAASAGDLRLARDLSILETALETDRHYSLFALLRDRETLVHPEDDVGEASQLLLELGAHKLAAEEVAARLDLRLFPGAHEEALALICEWFESLRFRRTAVSSLKTNAILLDRDGIWRRPDEVMLEAEDVPLPPRPIRRIAISPPKRQDLLRFIAELGVHRFTAERALNDVLASIKDETYGRSEEQCKRIFAYLYNLWKLHPRSFEDSDGVGEVPLPARDVKGSNLQWRPADDLYLPTDLGGAATDELYGPFGQCEFVDAARLPHLGEKVRRFLITLGVQEKPRIDVLAETFMPTHGIYPASDDPFRDWRNISSVREAQRCDGGHPATPREYHTLVLDRLDVILEEGDRAVLKALAAALSALADPMLEPAKVTCLHPGKRSSKKAPSYQGWRLTSTNWIPVDGPVESLRRPDEAWFGVPKNSTLLLPKADLPDGLAERLGLVRYSRPSRRALERSLADLADRFPDPTANGEAAVETAFWLMDRLDGLELDGEQAQEPPPLLVTYAGSWEWSDRAIVPDIPHLELLTTLERLPAGRWSGLVAAYALPRASEVVDWIVRPGTPSGQPPLLGQTDKAALVALLSRSSDQRRVARRLGRIMEQPVTEVTLSLLHEESTVSTPPLPFHLEVSMKEGNVARADLFTTSVTEGSLYGLCAVLADYLEEERKSDLIFAYFMAPQQVLAQHRITTARLEEAEEALTRYPAEEDLVTHIEATTEMDGDPTLPAATADDHTTLEPDPSQPDRPVDDSGWDGALSDERHPSDTPGSERSAWLQERSASGGSPEKEPNQEATDREVAPRTTSVGGSAYLRTYVLHDAPDDNERFGRRDRTPVEQAGIEVALRYEREQGREPAEMEPNHPGYDIESHGDDGDLERLIEVKALRGPWIRAAAGLSVRQFTTGAELGERFWLYVVEDAQTSEPKLHRIHDPVNRVNQFLFDDGWRSLAEDD